MFRLWWNVLRRPVETFRAEKGKASFLAALKQISLAFIIVIALVFVFDLAGFFVLSNTGITQWESLPMTPEQLKKYEGMSSVGKFINIPSAPTPQLAFTTTIFMILAWPLAIVSILIQSALFFLAAKLFGGKGLFKEMFYLSSITVASLIAPAEILILIIGALAFVSSLILILIPVVLLIVLVYLIVLLTLAIKEATGLTAIKSFFVWLIAMVIIGALDFLIYIITSPLP